MVKEDIHDLKGVLDRNSEKYILQLFEEDQNDVRRFTDDLLANTISAGRVVKYLYSLVVIKRRLNMSFRSANVSVQQHLGVKNLITKLLEIFVTITT